MRKRVSCCCECMQSGVFKQWVKRFAIMPCIFYMLLINEPSPSRKDQERNQSMKVQSVFNFSTLFDQLDLQFLINLNVDLAKMMFGVDQIGVERQLHISVLRLFIRRKFLFCCYSDDEETAASSSEDEFQKVRFINVSNIWQDIT